jgi:hypothetical protein
LVSCTWTLKKLKNAFLLKTFFCNMMILEVFGSRLAFKKLGFGVWMSSYFEM